MWRRMALVKSDVSGAVSKRLTLFFIRIYFFYPEGRGDMFLRNVGFYKTRMRRHIQEDCILHVILLLKVSMAT
jgi:hypothetical protein